MNSLFPEIISSISALFLIILAFMALLGMFRKGINYKKVDSFSFYKVSVPINLEEKDSEKISHQKYLEKMEKFLVKVSVIQNGVKKWNKFLHGEAYFSCEFLLKGNKKKVDFFLATPKKAWPMFHHHLTNIFGNIDTEEISGYDLMTESSATIGASAGIAHHASLPLRTYTYHFVDPLSKVLELVGSELREGESLGFQLVLRPQSHSKIPKQTQTMLRRLENSPSMPHMIASAVKRKAQKNIFHSNIRILILSGSEKRSAEILKSLKRALTIYTFPNGNNLEVEPKQGRGLSSLINNYLLRIFEPSKAVHLSSEEIASLFHFAAKRS